MVIDGFQDWLGVIALKKAFLDPFNIKNLYGGVFRASGNVSAIWRKGSSSASLSVLS